MFKSLVLLSILIVTPSYGAGINVSWEGKIPTLISSIETSKHISVENDKVIWEENGVKYITPFAKSSVVILKDQTLVSKDKAIAMVSWDL